MRIGYLIPEFPAQTHAFFWREAQGLADSGLQVRFLSTRRPAQDTSRHAFTATARAQTAYLFPPSLRTALKLLLTRPRRALRALAYVAGLTETPPHRRAVLAGLLLPAAHLAALARREGLDHIHIHSFANAAHLGALCHRLGGPPFSLTLHGDLPVYGRDHAAKVAEAAFVTAVTEPLCAAIRATCPGSTPHHLSMGVDTERFAPVVAAVTDGPLRITSIARLNYVKGHACLLDAMAALVASGHDLTYAIAGDGPYRAEIVAKVAQLGLGSRVTLLGPLSEDGVLALLRASDVFALTSFGLGEAAPVAVMEAMACGLPVICSRIGGTGDMIADGRDGILVPQQDVAAIAEALTRLGDRATRHRIGQAARATALARFDYRHKAAELAALIRASQA